MSAAVSRRSPPPVAISGAIGRYEVLVEIASGGMATVHLARLVGPVSFSRTVAVKRLHRHLAGRPHVVTAFLEEARVAGCIRHANVAAILDIVQTPGETFLVMEYVHGESAARLFELARKRREPVPVPVACATVAGMLRGLDATHKATGDGGKSLGIVHCDVSPQNVMVGADGVARIIDFGIATTPDRRAPGREGRPRGKVSYSAPEVVRGEVPTPAADIYSAGVVLWEALTGERLFSAQNEANALERVLFGAIKGPKAVAANVPDALDAIVLKALSRDPAARFASAAEMARAIEGTCLMADASEVGEWVERLAGPVLAERAGRIAGAGDASGDLLAFGPPAPATDTPADQAKGSPLLQRVLLGAATITAIVGLGSVVLARRDVSSSKRSAATAVASALAPQDSPPAAQASAHAAQATTEAPPTVSVAAGPADQAPPPAVPARRGNTAGAPARAAPAREVAPGRPAAAPPSRCSPPWTVDGNGIKQYRLECL
jgi:serine/threonine-protein kinase